MSTPEEDIDGPAAGSVFGSAVRSSVSGGSDAVHKHVSPHIGQIDSGKRGREQPVGSGARKQGEYSDWPSVTVRVGRTRRGRR